MEHEGRGAEHSAGVRRELVSSSAFRLGLTLAVLRPKTDTFGKCDPFIEMELEGSVQKSKTVKNCYSAEYRQVFHFPEAAQTDSVRFVLYDANQLSKAEKIGGAEMPLSQVKLEPSELVLHVLDDEGRVVTGQDGKQTIIRAEMSFVEEKDSRRSEDADESDASKRYDLEIKALSFSNMPKMDLMGSCDAYLRIKVLRVHRGMAG
eukprot:768772-Hanusia_phi.AAC.8